VARREEAPPHPSRQVPPIPPLINISTSPPPPSTITTDLHVNPSLSRE
jgi:hypothetical protein